MKSLTTKLMTIVAAALVAAGAASAQELKANIPFAFVAGGKVMAAGTYGVYLNGLRGAVTIRGEHSVSLAMPLTAIEGTHQNPSLVFECGRGPCALVQAWSGGSELGIKFTTPKRNRGEEASLAVIPLRRDAAE